MNQPGNPLPNHTPKYPLAPIYFPSPPTAAPRRETVKSVMFFISLSLQVILGALLSFMTLLAPLAYDGCYTNCDNVDRWIKVLVASGIVAVVLGLSSIIFWTRNKRIAFMFSSLVWLTMAFWVGVFFSGSLQ